MRFIIRAQERIICKKTITDVCAAKRSTSKNQSCSVFGGFLAIWNESGRMRFYLSIMANHIKDSLGLTTGGTNPSPPALPVENLSRLQTAVNTAGVTPLPRGRISGLGVNKIARELTDLHVEMVAVQRESEAVGSRTDETLAKIRARLATI